MKEVERDDAAREDLVPDLLDMLRHSVALVGLYDRDEILRYANEAFRAAYFLAPDERIDWQTLMRRNFAARRGTVIETDDIESWISSVRSRRGKSRQRTYESDLHGGRFIWVNETRRDDGWILYVGTDVTQLNVSERHLRLLNDKLSRQSFTDELTGVSNRRHVLGQLQAALDEGQAGWACLLDIDHFKAINDACGHQTGDDVLVAVAQTVRRTLRLTDGFGRVGGEEFLILFAQQPFDDVMSTLRRLQAAIGGLDVLRGPAARRITVSGGVTDVSRKDTQAQVLRRADLGLYRAKENGRDRLHVVASDDRFEAPALARGEAG
ncbi:GGDEF domain-containing protein [Aureimonas sp. AU4]|uniref:GGDEF domain-containing protein n=1 Tax=Aureimonas sp. AU4 TaxID=1638163 RepID=UPI00178C8F00|nr:GGDEF domain-containing protein [Aureimonas sp. AU4]